jgi:uncharacterized protein (TIGR00725 family)
MEAASKGAKSANGVTVGILPEAHESAANPFVDLPLPTGIGYARNFVNIISGNSIISLAGSSGTLSEIGYAIALEKRLVLVKGTGGVTEMIIQHMDLFPNADIHATEDCVKAVRIALNLENP